jgi:hypothetical protein
MNDVQFAEAARVFAENVLSLSGVEGDNRNRLNQMFKTATGRQADAVELKALNNLLDQQLKYFASKPDDAKLVAAVGKHPMKANIGRDIVAAWTMVAQAVLNSDACVWKR